MDPAHETPASAGRRRRVVLVEDDPDLRVVVEAGLRERYDVSSIARGDVAVEEIERRAPDIVLLDIHLPGINGFEVCERLKASPRSRGIPILFLTSRRDSWSRVRCDAAGGDGYLAKPFTVPDLVAGIEALVGR